MNAGAPATISDGRTFFQFSAGRWAGEQMRAAMQRGQALTPAVLRTNTTLMRDEWIYFDDVVVAAAQVPLRAVADLISFGLTRSIANGMAKTVLLYETSGDMQPAVVSMDGVTRAELDRVEFGQASIPLPITHKDFNIDMRQLLASRERGEPLDTLQSRIAGTKCGQMTEYLVFNGGVQFLGLPIYGYLTHPNRNLLTYGAGGDWAQVAKTGDQIVGDVLSMQAALVSDLKLGPYALYYSTDYSKAMSADYKAMSTDTVTTRLMKIPGLQNMQMAEQLPPKTVVLVQMTVDVVELITGQAITTVEWEIVGPFLSGFKAFQIEVPLVRADADGKSGIAIMQ